MTIFVPYAMLYVDYIRNGHRLHASDALHLSGRNGKRHTIKNLNTVVISLESNETIRFSYTFGTIVPNQVDDGAA